MTRTRKLTLKEFSHLVSESLDLANATPSPQSLLDNTTLLSRSTHKTHVSLSSFQRIFSRPTPTPGRQQESLQGSFDDPPESPRKVTGWPFSRSPKKNRPSKDQGIANETNDPDVCPYPISSLATASTSSFGSLLPDDERVFQVTLRERDAPNHVSSVVPSSSVIVASPRGSELESSSGCQPSAVPLDALFGNVPAAPVLASTTVEAARSTSSRSSLIRASSEITEASHSLTISESASVDEDPTPKASTFDTRATLPIDGLSVTERGPPRNLSIAVPPRKTTICSLRPAVGVEPHAPSETDSSASVYSISPPTSPVARPSSPIFPTMTQPDAESSSSRTPIPPNACTSSTSSVATSPSTQDLGLAVGFSPQQRKRVLSRSQTPPPLPRPPPTGPLPAVPSSIPPVPPLPPFLSKMNTSPNSVISLPSRLTLAGASTNPASALPPSPPGALRLPSRLSWVNNVRAALPSPPASPTKALRTLTGKSSLPISSPKAEINRPNELKRPTSIGVIEAADNIQVRRTKSILLRGSRSKSNASLGTKRVQIHADVNVDACTARKPRRSSAAALGHPTSCSDFCPVITMQGSELLVPRERRHSAPVLSSLECGASADWTLSLPFCIDTPGNKIAPLPLLTPQSKVGDKLEEVEGEDWTLCMPLKVRPSTPTISSAGPSSARPSVETVETVEVQHNTQLPTPSPSPTWATPTSATCSLDLKESIPSSPIEQSVSSASLSPDAGGLDLEGGCGKRASGWHVYGWFDDVCVPEEDTRDVDASATTANQRACSPLKSHVAAFRKVHDLSGRQPSQDSMCTMSSSTSTSFYSAVSS